MSRIFVSGALLYLGLISIVTSGQNCGEDKVRKCIAIAEPMLKDPHLIFPDNMNDINNVCRTWSNFVDCIRRYIDKCFSKVRKDQFNTAVEPPIASVHQMCSVSSYQAEYLQYAGCIKSMVIEPEHCGGHYSILVSEVSQENVRKPNLCCAYHNFRTCVIMKTRLRCDNNQIEGIAAKFSRQVLDKAFRFLQDQCLNYIPDTSKCSALLNTSSRSSPQPITTTTTSISRLGEGRVAPQETTLRPLNNVGARRSPPSSSYGDVYHRTGKSNVDQPSAASYNTMANTAQSIYYESAARGPGYTTNRETIRASSNTQPVTSVNSGATSSSLSSSFGIQQARKTNGVKVNDDKNNEELIYGRPEEKNRKTEQQQSTRYSVPIVDNSAPLSSSITQRSPNYGRGISWTTATLTSTSEIPDWATNTWLTYNQDFTTEVIYPAAGSFGGNNIDEPNQQGLSRNCQRIFHSSSLLRVVVIACSIAFASLFSYF